MSHFTHRLFKVLVWPLLLLQRPWHTSQRLHSGQWCSFLCWSTWVWAAWLVPWLASLHLSLTRLKYARRSWQVRTGTHTLILGQIVLMHFLNNLRNEFFSLSSLSEFFFLAIIATCLLIGDKYIYGCNWNFFTNVKLLWDNVKAL